MLTLCLVLLTPCSLLVEASAHAVANEQFVQHAHDLQAQQCWTCDDGKMTSHYATPLLETRQCIVLAVCREVHLRLSWS